MSKKPAAEKSPLREFLQTIGVILGIPVVLFGVINSIFQQPTVSLIVAIITGIVLSIWLAYSRKMNFSYLIITWLSFAVMILFVFVIWPKTMTLEGFVNDSNGQPVVSETVEFFDYTGKVYETQTDQNGFYQFLDVPIGKYRIRVRTAEIQGETKGVLVRVVQQSISISSASSASIQSSPSVTETPPDTPVPKTTDGTKTYNDLIVGFANLNSTEGDWQMAKADSIKSEARRLGVDLKYIDSGSHTDQVAAVRSFISDKVDVIGITPVAWEGWTTVLMEAKDAGIPIIMVDRRADFPEDLYATYLSSDFVEEGRNAARIMAKIVNGKASIVELVGPVDGSAAIDRQKGFREIIDTQYPDMKIIASESGDWSSASGKEVMTTFLKRHGSNITAVYSHNDQMALGAIEATEAYGLRPGVDIKIVSIDAERVAFEAMIAGKLNATIECSPILGPQFFEIALKLANHEPVDKWFASEEGVYLQEAAAEELPYRKY